MRPLILVCPGHRLHLPTIFLSLATSNELPKSKNLKTPLSFHDSAILFTTYKEYEYTNVLAHTLFNANKRNATK